MDVFQIKYSGVKCSCVLCMLVNTINFMLCSNLVMTVHKFDSRLLLKRISDKLRAVESDKCSDGDVCLQQNLYVFFVKLSRT